MQFYCLYVDEEHETVKLLKKAAEEKGIEFVGINPNKLENKIVRLDKGQLYYRDCNRQRRGVLEAEQSMLDKKTTTFYQDWDYVTGGRRLSDSYSLPKLGVATPRIAYLVTTSREELQEKVEELGGYPVILKVIGGTHGVGVMRADSYASLCTIVDYLQADGTRFVLKEYIESDRTARLIVLGEQVIDSIEYRANEGDFRSNEGVVPNVGKASYDRQVHELAERAVRALGLEFGGVDILLSDRGPMIAEVNFPCYFARAQNLTGVDIAGMMLEYLREKAKDVRD